MTVREMIDTALIIGALVALVYVCTLGVHWLFEWWEAGDDDADAAAMRFDYIDVGDSSDWTDDWTDEPLGPDWVHPGAVHHFEPFRDDSQSNVAAALRAEYRELLDRRDLGLPLDDTDSARLAELGQFFR